MTTVWAKALFKNARKDSSECGRMLLMVCVLDDHALYRVAVMKQLAQRVQDERRSETAMKLHLK
jgi:hypothetical protein